MAERKLELCPRCTRDYQETREGLCRACHMEDRRSNYAERDRARIDARRAWWRDRQRLHRDRARFRPTEPLSEGDDPFETGREALDEIDRLRDDIGSADLLARLDNVAELVKQLAWGPEEASPA